MKSIILKIAVLAMFLAVSCEGTQEEVEIHVESVSIEPEEITVKAGDTASLAAVVLPENATNKNVGWYSEDNSIVTVDNDGSLTAVSVGETRVFIVTEDGSKTAYCGVTVVDRDIPVESITVEPDSLSMVVGDIVALSVRISPDNATGKSVVWTSSDESIASVNEDGKVEGTGIGEADITVSSEQWGKSAVCHVTVGDNYVAVTGVAVSPANMTLEIGEQGKFTALIFPSYATEQSVTWATLDPDVASVSDDGTVTALSSGVAYITATTADGGFSSYSKAAVTGGNVVPEEWVLVPAGTFMMGSPETEENRMESEVQHEVTISRDFYISKYEVTNSQFADFLNEAGIGQDGMGEVTYPDKGTEVTETRQLIMDSSLDAGLGGQYDFGVHWDAEASMWKPADGCDNYPVIFVTWYGAMAYAAHKGGCLPTEAQWEYACRAGSSTAYFWGETSSEQNEYGWCYTIGDKAISVRLHPVGGKSPNGWGIYDMVGNVCELCLDWDGDYPEGPVTDPVGPDTGEWRILRGSCFLTGGPYSRSAYRDGYLADNPGAFVGFRIVKY